MIDSNALAALFSALSEVPNRLAALERAEAKNAAKLESVRVALPPVLATIPEAATAFKVSIPTMRRWVKRGDVPIVKVGSTVRVDLSRLHGKDAANIASQAAEALTSQSVRSVPVVIRCPTKLNCSDGAHSTEAEAETQGPRPAFDCANQTKG